MIPITGFKKHVYFVMLAATSVILMSCAETFPSKTSANITFNEEDYAAANSLRGGRLYDKWWEEKGIQTPGGSNPIWQAVTEQIPGNSNSNEGGQWRCKECHGWDYKGSEGAYNTSSSHYTGIRGLNNGNPNFTPEHVFNMIVSGFVPYAGKTNISHQYVDAAGGKMNATDAYDLASFVVNFARSGTNPTLGDASRGELVYKTIPPANNNSQSCNNFACHTPTTPTTPDDVKDLATENPAEFIHKVRFGSAGATMPAGMSIGEAQDLYAYVISGAGDLPTAPPSDYDPALYIAADAVLGGKLYDKWWELPGTSVAPTATDTHPRWPTESNPTTGPETWRCKECHGWDYRGVDGAYSSGSHRTGFQGIVGTTMKYATSEDVYAFIKEDSNHGTGKINGTDYLLKPAEYYALAKFIMTVREPAQSTVNFIDDITKLTKNTDATAGKTLYLANSTQCSSSGCHGIDGKRIEFEDGNDDTLPNKYVHTQALDNPWEFIHKIRFGVTGSGQFMPALYSSNDATIKSVQAAANILASAQTNLVPNIKRAGLLYDEWWNVVGIKNASVPTTRNKSWKGTADITKVTDEETWRCKECHGWDYQGVHGAYGDTTSKHYSGISGFYSTDIPKPTKDGIINTVKNGTATLLDHDFGRFLSDTDIEAIADFILDKNLGVPDSTALYAGLLTGGNVTTGKALYDAESPANCANLGCHGPQGTNISTVDVGAAANDNPPEFLHKVRYGHPGSTMVPTSDGFSGLDLQAASNVLAYAKTLSADPGPGPGPGPGPDPTYTYATADLIRGGRLYDEWWKEMQTADPSVTAPSSYNPLWDLRDASIPDIVAAKKIETSWRCKNCHAWDYKGIGFYNDERDNLFAKIEARRTTYPNETDLQQHIHDWIKSGLGFTLHKFGEATTGITSFLSERELWDLTKFLLEGGLLDSNTNILAGKVIGANSIRGGGIYTGTVNDTVNCATCHGEEGNQIPSIDSGGSGEPLDIFELASPADNPWEFIHKVRFGQPGTSMPSLIGADLSNKDAFDVLDYAQQKFEAR